VEHFFIATTMLAVGILAVLSWDSTLPDRRDVLVLAPLSFARSHRLPGKGGGSSHGTYVLAIAPAWAIRKPSAPGMRNPTGPTTVAPPPRLPPCSWRRCEGASLSGGAFQVDRGSEFAAVFEEACQQRGLRRFVLRPRPPKLNGRVKQANRTNTESMRCPCSLPIA
jgi:hypothetical protein